jgi:hypothetical protein
VAGIFIGGMRGAALAQLPTPSTPPQAAEWQYGAMGDVAYGLNFNFPENHLWRSKETTPRTNELALNMVRGYLRRDPLQGPGWGMELALQGGYDTEGLVPDEDPLSGADTLRHISRANISYVTAIGNGLRVSAGLMQGYVNYESFYATNNFNYTRAYLTDYTPNFMLGASAWYPINGNMDVGLHLMNGFNHLSHPNDAPSFGFDADWRLAKRTSLAQNFYYGPDQTSTSLRFWRFFSDTQLEWRGDDVTVAAIYDVGTEQLADQSGNPRAFWTSAALFTRYAITGPWSAAVRPEFFWDRNARMTSFQQFIWAMTTTVEYRQHFGPHMTVVRLEHRYDHSTGTQGGFFRRGAIAPGVLGLNREQHLLWLSLIWAYDS